MSGFRSWSLKFWSRTQGWCLTAPLLKKHPSLRVSLKLSQHRAYPSCAPQVIKSKSPVTWTLICRKILSISSQSQTWAESLNAPTPPSNRRKQQPAPSISSCLSAGRKLLLIRIINRWWPHTRLRWSAAAAPTSTIASSMTQQRTSCGQLLRWSVALIASRPVSTVRSHGQVVWSAISVSLPQPTSASEVQAALKHLTTPTETSMTARMYWTGHGPSHRRALAPCTIAACLLLEPCSLRIKPWETRPLVLPPSCSIIKRRKNVTSPQMYTQRHFSTPSTIVIRAILN